MKATYLNLFNLIKDSVEKRFPDKIVVVLCKVSYHPESRAILSTLALSFSEVSTADYIFVEFSTVEEAIKFCRKIPHFKLYTVIFRNGAAIRENT